MRSFFTILAAGFVACVTLIMLEPQPTQTQSAEMAFEADPYR